MFAADLPERLSAALASHQALRQQRARFAPQLSYGRHMGPSASNARNAAVLLIIFRRNGKWQLPLTVRQSHLPDHAGQVSLPGGMLEPNESSDRGALREAEEEIGIAADSVQLLGSLSPIYVFNSNFHVIPWVGYIADEPTFQHDDREVAELFEYPLSALVGNDRSDVLQIVRGRLSFYAPCIRWQQFTIWGATSMILGEFQAVLETLLSDRPSS